MVITKTSNDAAWMVKKTQSIADRYCRYIRIAGYIKLYWLVPSSNAQRTAKKELSTVI